MHGVLPPLFTYFVIAVFSLVFVYPLMLLVGVPSYFLFRTLRVASAWSAVGVGLFTAWLGFPLAASALSRGGFSFSANIVHNNYWTRIFDPHLLLNPLILLGGAVGLIFWWLVFWIERSDHSSPIVQFNPATVSRDISHGGFKIIAEVSPAVLLIAGFVANQLIPTLSLPQTPSEVLSVRAFSRNPSTDASPVRATIKGLHFVIPRDYLTWADVTLAGDATLVLALRLPDFQGATNETIGCFVPKTWYHCPLQVVVSIPEGWPHIRSNSVAIVERQRNQAHEMVYGLAKLTKPGGWPGDWYVHIAKNANDDFIIECAPMYHRTFDGQPIDDCSVHGEIAGKLSFNYTFHESQLAHWQQIDAGINRLLNSFLVEDH